jgi:hypothetical protein
LTICTALFDTFLLSLLFCHISISNNKCNFSHSFHNIHEFLESFLFLFFFYWGLGLLKLRHLTLSGKTPRKYLEFPLHWTYYPSSLYQSSSIKLPLILNLVLANILFFKFDLVVYLTTLYSEFTNSIKARTSY